MEISASEAKLPIISFPIKSGLVIQKLFFCKYLKRLHVRYLDVKLPAIGVGFAGTQAFFAPKLGILQALKRYSRPNWVFYRPLKRYSRPNRVFYRHSRVLRRQNCTGTHAIFVPKLGARLCVLKSSGYCMLLGFH